MNNNITNDNWNSYRSSMGDRLGKGFNAGYVNETIAIPEEKVEERNRMIRSFDDAINKKKNGLPWSLDYQQQKYVDELFNRQSKGESLDKEDGLILSMFNERTYPVNI